MPSLVQSITQRLRYSRTSTHSIRVGLYAGLQLMTMEDAKENVKKQVAVKVLLDRKLIDDYLQEVSRGPDRRGGPRPGSPPSVCVCVCVCVCR